MRDPNTVGLSSCIDVSSWITLRWVRGTRYYRVHLEQDLWSNWLLTQVNGRVGSLFGPRTLTPGAIHRGRIVRVGGNCIAPTQTGLPI